MVDAVGVEAERLEPGAGAVARRRRELDVARVAAVVDAESTGEPFGAVGEVGARPGRRHSPTPCSS